MYIDRVTLKNIRGFEELDFLLRRPDKSYPGWTVFLGDNGSGKSTVMRSIALCLAGRDTANKLLPDMKGWIRKDMQKESSIQLSIVRTEGDDRSKDSGRKPLSAFQAKLILKNGGKQVSIEASYPKGRSADRAIWATDAIGWFACGYGPFRRVFGASSEATINMFGPLTGRFATMFNEAASLMAADQWLRELAHKQKDGRNEGDLLDVVVKLLNNGLLPNEMRVSRVDSNGLWLRDRQGVELDWSEMSDGYRSMLALICDIVRHMREWYGTIDLFQEAADGTLHSNRSGVILIDEVDSHLHPEWQREIGFWLTKHFPKMQFIVTTHSPLVCQAASPNGLFKLPEPGSGQRPSALPEELIQKIRASKADTILLSPAFGLDNTRSPIAVESRAKLAQLNAKKRAGVSLSAQEKELEKQYALFVNEDEV